MTIDPLDSSIAERSALSRAAVLGYGVLSYLIFFGTFLYLVGFIGDVLVPKTINSGPPGPLLESIGINVGLLALFAIQHTVMTRAGFKRWWTTIIPEAIERSTFVFVTSLLLILIVWQWRPLPEVIWQVEGGIGLALYALSGLGWGIVLLSTFLIAFWFTPTMTFGHLLFAGVATAYVPMSLQIEEASLLALHPEEYASYKKRVRMLLPFPRARG